MINLSPYRVTTKKYRLENKGRCHEEVHYLEDIGSGIYITDLTLNDFRMDLAEYLKDHEQELIHMPPGCRAIVEPDEFVADGDQSAGVLFCLKSDNPNISREPNYYITHYYLVAADRHGPRQRP